MKTTKNQTISSAGSRKILQGYNKDTIALMPVNAVTNFIYWEITEKLLERKKMMSNPSSEKLVVKVFDEDFNRSIYSFDVERRIGKHYMKYSGPQRRLVAKIGFVHKGTFMCILSSRPMTVSSLKKESTDYEIWMQKSKDGCKTFRTAKVDTLAEERLQQLIAKYHSESTMSPGGSLFGSMTLSLP